MINLNDYFDPVSIEKPLWQHLTDQSSLSRNLVINTESSPVTNSDGVSMAIIGVPDDRRSPNKGCGEAPDNIRSHLYTLSRLTGKLKIADLGNIKKGFRFDDTLAALRDVIIHLKSRNTTLLILGGSSALITAADKAMSVDGDPYRFLSVDSRIDFNNEKKEKDSFNFLSDIIYNKRSSLSAFTGIGYQRFLNDLQVINRFKKLGHETLRIGEVRETLNETEPLFRDSELVAIDISSVRQSDAPGTFAPSPNGFYTEEICLLSRYAGLSDNLKIFFLTEVNPLLDSRGQTVSLAAQACWFFLDGFSQKQNESLLLNDDRSGRFIRYHVKVPDLEEDLVFIKSTVTNRWWIEYADKGKNKFIACSHHDYLVANDGQIPAKWIKAVSR